MRACGRNNLCWECHVDSVGASAIGGKAYKIWAVGNGYMSMDCKMDGFWWLLAYHFTGIILIRWLLLNQDGNTNCFDSYINELKYLVWWTTRWTRWRGYVCFVRMWEPPSKPWTVEQMVKLTGYETSTLCQPGFRAKKLRGATPKIKVEWPMNGLCTLWNFGIWICITYTRPMCSGVDLYYFDVFSIGQKWNCMHLSLDTPSLIEKSSIHRGSTLN